MECLDFKSELIRRKEELKSSIERFLNTEVIDKQQDYPLLRHGISGMKSKMFVEVLTGKFNSFQPETKVLLLRLLRFSEFNFYFRDVISNIIEAENEDTVTVNAILMVPFVFERREEAAEKLVNILENTNNNYSIRRAAVWSLGRIEKVNHSVIEVLFNILRRKDDVLRISIIGALEKIGNRDTELKEQIIEEFFAILKSEREEIYGNEIEFQDPIKERIIEALVSLRYLNANIVSTFIGFLAEESSLRFKSEEALVKLGKSEWNNLIIQALINVLNNNKDGIVQVMVIRILKEIDVYNREVIQTLMNIWRECKDATVCEEALAALKEIIRSEESRALKILFECLGVNHLDFRDISTLIRVLVEGNILLKAAAVSSLGESEEIREDLINVLILILNLREEWGFVKERAVNSLGKVLERVRSKELKEKIIKALIEFLKDRKDSQGVLKEAIASLGRVGEFKSEVIEVLKEILIDRTCDYHVRCEAARTLGKLGRYDGSGEILEILGECLRNIEEKEEFEEFIFWDEIKFMKRMIKKAIKEIVSFNVNKVVIEKFLSLIRENPYILNTLDQRKSNFCFLSPLDLFDLLGEDDIFSSNLVETMKSLEIFSDDYFPPTCSDLGDIVRIDGGIDFNYTNSICEFLTYLLKSDFCICVKLRTLTALMNICEFDPEIAEFLIEYAQNSEIKEFIGRELAKKGMFVPLFKEPAVYLNKYFRGFLGITYLDTGVEEIDNFGVVEEFHFSSQLKKPDSILEFSSRVFKNFFTVLKASFIAHSGQMLKFDSLRGVYNFLKVD